MTASEQGLLLGLIAKIPEIKNQTAFEKWMNTLNQIIPFSDYGFGMVHIQSLHRYGVEGLIWFHKFQGFEETYLGKKLYEIDPVTLRLLDQFSKEKPAVQFWADTYQNSDCAKFIEEISHFPIVSLNGYTFYVKLNAISCVVLSLCGERIQRDEKTENILKIILPALSTVPQNVPLGSNRILTRKQFAVRQLLSTSVNLNQAAECLGLSRSSIEKHYSAIKKKMGIDDRGAFSMGNPLHSTSKDWGE